MRLISIITTDGQTRLEQLITEEQHESEVFEVETSGYLIQITQTKDSIEVTNAMNGYGQNCREDFKDALIEVFVN